MNRQKRTTKPRSSQQALLSASSSTPTAAAASAPATAKRKTSSRSPLVIWDDDDDDDSDSDDGDDNQVAVNNHANQHHEDDNDDDDSVSTTELARRLKQSTGAVTSTKPPIASPKHRFNDDDEKEDDGFLLFQNKKTASKESNKLSCQPSLPSNVPNARVQADALFLESSTSSEGDDKDQDSVNTIELMQRLKKSTSVAKPAASSAVPCQTEEKIANDGGIASPDIVLHDDGGDSSSSSSDDDESSEEGDDDDDDDDEVLIGYGNDDECDDDDEEEDLKENSQSFLNSKPPSHESPPASHRGRLKSSTDDKEEDDKQKRSARAAPPRLHNVDVSNNKIKRLQQNTPATLFEEVARENDVQNPTLIRNVDVDDHRFEVEDEILFNDAFLESTDNTWQASPTALLATAAAHHRPNASHFPYNHHTNTAVERQSWREPPLNTRNDKPITPAIAAAPPPPPMNPSRSTRKHHQNSNQISYPYPSTVNVQNFNRRQRRVAEMLIDDGAWEQDSANPSIIRRIHDCTDERFMIDEECLFNNGFFESTDCNEAPEDIMDRFSSAFTAPSNAPPQFADNTIYRQGLRALVASPEFNTRSRHFDSPPPTASAPNVVVSTTATKTTANRMIKPAASILEEDDILDDFSDDERPRRTSTTLPVSRNSDRRQQQTRPRRVTNAFDDPQQSLGSLDEPNSYDFSTSSWNHPASGMIHQTEQRASIATRQPQLVPPRPGSSSLRSFVTSAVSLQPIRPPQWTAAATTTTAPQRGRKLRDASANNPALARCVVSRHQPREGAGFPRLPPATASAIGTSQMPFVQASEAVFYRHAPREDTNVASRNFQPASGFAEAPRNDLQGGSGVGLGRYQLPSEKPKRGQKRVANDDDDDQSSSHNASRPAPAAAKKRKRSTTATTKKKKAGGWKKGGRRQRKGGGARKKSAASTKSRTASSNRRSSGNSGGGGCAGWSTAGSVISTLPTSRQDPLLSNVGGADITF